MEINHKEVRNLLQFLLCQLRSECNKLLGKGAEFDEELKRIDSEFEGRDIFSIDVIVLHRLPCISHVR
jgi:hypothetical protein